MQFFQMGRKGSMGLTDFFSLIAIGIIVIFFYAFIKLSIGNTSFDISSDTQKIEGQESLLGILRQSVNVDGNSANIGQLVSLATIDNTKKALLERSLIGAIDQSFGTSSCNLFCINGEKIEGTGCLSLKLYLCPEVLAYIPGYDTNPIAVAFEQDAKYIDYHIK